MTIVCGVYAQGDNYTLAKKLGQQLPCPIHGNVNKIQMSRQGFVDACLAFKKKSKKRDG